MINKWTFLGLTLRRKLDRIAHRPSLQGHDPIPALATSESQLGLDWFQTASW